MYVEVTSVLRIKMPEILYSKARKSLSSVCEFFGHRTTAYIYKWKNHFYEMKGDVGMSLHEKERNKKMPTPRHKVTHNPIPTFLFCFNMLFVCLL